MRGRPPGGDLAKGDNTYSRRKTKNMSKSATTKGKKT